MLKVYVPSTMQNLHILTVEEAPTPRDPPGVSISTPLAANVYVFGADNLPLFQFFAPLEGMLIELRGK